MAHRARDIDALEALPMVHHLEQQLVGVDPATDLHACRARVRDGVGDRFLHDPVRTDLDVHREARRRRAAGRRDLDDDVRLLPVTCERLEREGEAQVVEDRRMEIARDVAETVRDPSEGVSFELGVGAPLEALDHPGDDLQRVVVQAPRQLRALRLGRRGGDPAT